MSGSVSGLSQLGYAPYMGQNPFQLQPIQGVQGVPSQITEIANGNFSTGTNLLQQSQGGDTFSSSFGMLPQTAFTPSFSNNAMAQNIGVSYSTIEVMGTINNLMSGVALNLGGFVQTLLASYQARKAKEEAEGKTGDSTSSTSSSTASKATNPATKTALASSSTGTDSTGSKKTTTSEADSMV